MSLHHTLLSAQNWDVIRQSGDYYYGEGTGADEEKAGNVALDNLLQMISVHVSSDFQSIYDGVNRNGQLDWKEWVRQCVQTYTHSTLTNVQCWTVQTAPTAIVRKYMLKSELAKTYEARIERLKGMIKTADYALARGNVDVALQYYYWAYSFLRSLQHPHELKDETGQDLINVLPLKIQEIIGDIQVEYVGRDGDYVDLSFTYQGKPISIDFTYNDGRKDDCDCKAEGGNASIEMAAGYAEAEAYHIRIEYEYRQFARGDAEVESVLSVIPRRSFGEEKKIETKGKRQNIAKPVKVDIPIENKSIAPTSNATNTSACASRMQQVLEALNSHQYEKIYSYFTGRGYDSFTRLIAQRKGRVMGVPKIVFDQGFNGLMYARGLQMAFSVIEKGHKTTLVDDVIFTFDRDANICNVTFGIGSIAENDLRFKNVNWGEETRQQILDFLENYKTAYCLKDLDYIKAIFDENATIIVGGVAKTTTRPGMDENGLSELGKDILVTYKRYTKPQYIDHLAMVFKRNQFVNIKFTQNDVMWLENEPGKVFSIQIGQEYSSSNYADIGYLFLMVDMTNPEEPLIKIRTWQPKPDPEFGLYGAGHFYKE